ncbi:hypothetical protein G3576_17850 [Roseomonas stagni]|uniref:LPS-assembly lipoprotein n=1 Tax=Falsiroseomonas algicola TaxID=2716930 RepID=A0A6M1LP10_9PROT|nr:hypothetical protein [Falsiroseomonas algicola]NGM21893.1 hypothetical protein [Falsiroseomonas algicola]
MTAIITITERRSKPWLALGLLFSLAACASGATPGAMTVPLSEQTMIADRSALRQAVRVGTVGGGQETNPLWASQVSNGDFAQALRQSLSTHAMLSMESGVFRLDAQLVALDQPLMGLDLTVRSRVLYRLTRVEGGAPVFEKEVAVSHNQSFGSAFAAVERLRLANEGAIRANIRQFLTELVAAERASPATFAAPARVS